MEITSSCINKFDVAKVVIRPPYRSGDIVDIELLFLSDEIPGHIEGYVTMDGLGNLIPRTFGGRNSPIDRTVRARLRIGVRQLATQLIGELSNG